MYKRVWERQRFDTCSTLNQCLHDTWAEQRGSEINTESTHERHASYTFLTRGRHSSDTLCQKSVRMASEGRQKGVRIVSE
eukprot:4979560-Amphidinium_carterae.1